MTLEILEEMKRVCDAATPGPWEYKCYSFYDEEKDITVTDGILRVVGDEKGFIGSIHSPNAEFLAESRTFSPRLIEALEWMLDDIGNRDYAIKQVRKILEGKNDGQ